MSRQVHPRFLFLIITLLTISGAVLADPVNLQSGNISAGGSNVLSLNGTGLNLQVVFTPPSLPYVNPHGMNQLTIEIKPSDLVQGPLVIGGVDYSGYLLSGTATFTIDLNHPVATGNGYAVTDTRLLTGTLAVIDPKTGATVAVLDFEFTAQIRVSLDRDPCGCYFVTGFTAQGNGRFNTPQPVPEPATLLLLGSGLAALGIRLRKKRWR
jgi:hypothetical protein